MTYYYNPMGFILPLLLIVFLFYFVSVLFGTTKSRAYRRELVNMYVAAKVRVIAAKENISIADEYESFKKWLKKQKIEEKGLDEAIEEELKDKIVEETKEKGK